MQCGIAGETTRLCTPVLTRPPGPRSQRMRQQGMDKGEVESMLCLLCEYEAKCLAGSEPVAPPESRQVRRLAACSPACPPACERGALLALLPYGAAQRSDLPSVPSTPSLPTHAHVQICSELDRRLRLVYNRPGEDPLVLDAHVMSAGALPDQEGAGAAHTHPLCPLSK